MLKAIKVRLYPTRGQANFLKQQIGCNRFVYNYFLNACKEHYEATGKHLNEFECHKRLTLLKQAEATRWLKDVNAQSLQQSIKDMQTAFGNFFKQLSGFPKFKAKGVKDTCRFPQRCVQQNNYLKLSKLPGTWIKFRGNVEQFVKCDELRNITVSLEAGKFYASCLVVDATNYKQGDFAYEACGIDVGVKVPVCLAFKSDDKTITHNIVTHKGSTINDVLLKKEKRRKYYQRVLARKQKGSNNRAKARLKVAKAFKAERDYRKDVIEQISYDLAKLFKCIKVESLKLKNMTKSAKDTIEQPGKNVAQKRGLNRALLRLGLGQLVVRLAYKAERLGSYVHAINPAYTSQQCSNCGYTHKDNRKSQAVFECLSCGFAANADANAATNILNGEYTSLVIA